MPELPEVETIRTELAASLSPGLHVRSVQIRRSKLRLPIPSARVRAVVGSEICAVRRRAKYLLFDIGDSTLISHLGMSGSWRFIDNSKEAGSEKFAKHDHVSLQLSDGRELVLNDPRRFGLLLVVPRGQEESNRWLKQLGVEPLSAEFTAQTLRSRAIGRSLAIKNFLMDQKVVVGIGNIYASEILHRAGVRPNRRIDRMTQAQWERVVDSTREILNLAIQNGGTTLRDYHTPDGSSGKFKNSLRVYDRAKLPCLTCSSEIQSRIIGGRATYWCKVCQT